jgi:iron complex outermembrane receptor protein
MRELFESQQRRSHGLHDASVAVQESVAGFTDGRAGLKCVRDTLQLYIDAVVLEDPTLRGKQLNNVARNTASVFLTYDFGMMFNGQLRAGIGERYVGARPGDANNSFFLPEYYLTDTFVSYRTTYNNLPVTWQFNANNIFDKTYYPSGISTTGVAVGDPREFTLQARVEF